MISIFSTILFTTGFLVLFIQFAIGKGMLPVFGGSPQVWLVSLGFYQALLALGYGAGYVLQRYLSLRIQALIYLILLVLCGYLGVPITMAESQDLTVIGVILYLLNTVALPFFILSMTSPLLQSWFSKLPVKGADNPYQLYVASNLGTFIGLLLYPFVIDYGYALPAQLSFFNMLYVGVSLVLGTVAILLCRQWWKGVVKKSSVIGSNFTAKSALLVALYGALASALLGVVSAQLTTEIAPMPLLWMLPLGIYFISFSVAFHDKFHLNDTWYILLWVVIMAIVLISLNNSLLMVKAVFLCLLLWLVSVICHYRVRNLAPAPEKLTLFYLVLSVGGALGGNAIGVAAPLVFSAYWEWGLILPLCALLILSAPFVKTFKAGLLVTLCITMIGAGFVWQSGGNTLYQSRSLMGVLKVEKDIFYDEKVHKLQHGMTTHGFQFREGDVTRLTTYYSIQGAIAQGVGDKVLREGVNIGIIGMGVGTLSCLFSEKAKIDFYEIDPAVIALAQNDTYFTYLRDCPHQGEVIVGDARLTLAQQVEKKYDVLIIDAFSSDAIPMHLLTQEALSVYQSRLTPQGHLVFHISNRYLRLAPPLAATAKSLGWSAAQCKVGWDTIVKESASYPTAAVVVSKELFENDCYKSIPSEGVSPWTDNFGSILPHIVW
jgi:hypothetical protein